MESFGLTLVIRKKIENGKKRKGKKYTHTYRYACTLISTKLRNTVLLTNRYGILKNKALVLVALLMLCHWKLKLYLLYVLVNYSKFYHEK